MSNDILMSFELVFMNRRHMLLYGGWQMCEKHKMKVLQNIVVGLF